MPVVSRFYGIIIAIYYDDHPPPHFHARYGSFQAKFDIRSGASIIGGFRRVLSVWCKNGVHCIRKR